MGGRLEHERGHRARFRDFPGYLGTNTKNRGQIHENRDKFRNYGTEIKKRGLFSGFRDKNSELGTVSIVLGTFPDN
jgi:hypothetical protein